MKEASRRVLSELTLKPKEQKVKKEVKPCQVKLLGKKEDRYVARAQENCEKKEGRKTRKQGKIWHG